MKPSVRINASAFSDMLRNPPPQFSHLGLLYSFLSVKVGSRVFPTDVWCDFSGVLLLRWNREVRELIEGKSRYARLIFTDTPNEVWLRRTDSHYWRASCVTWNHGAREIVSEALCLPEYVEASLHFASRQLLESARQADVWYEDCQSLEDFLENRSPSLD